MEYTDMLTAEQLIACIANDYIELSHDKVRHQRDDHIRWCKNWLKHNRPAVPDPEPSSEQKNYDF